VGVLVALADGLGRRAKRPDHPHRGPPPSRGRVGLFARRFAVPHALSCVALLMLLGLTLSGCGKKGEPQPPPGVPNTYPKIYPNA
jgi:hypothetical protein